MKSFVGPPTKPHKTLEPNSATRVIDPDADWDQDWRVEWKEARAKLDYYPPERVEKVGEAKKEKKSIRRFCSICLKMKRGTKVDIVIGYRYKATRFRPDPPPITKTTFACYKCQAIKLAGQLLMERRRLR